MGAVAHWRSPRERRRAVRMGVRSARCGYRWLDWQRGDTWTRRCGHAVGSGPCGPAVEPLTDGIGQSRRAYLGVHFISTESRYAGPARLPPEHLGSQGRMVPQPRLEAISNVASPRYDLKQIAL